VKDQRGERSSTSGLRPLKRLKNIGKKNGDKGTVRSAFRDQRNQNIGRPASSKCAQPSIAEIKAAVLFAYFVPWGGEKCRQAKLISALAVFFQKTQGVRRTFRCRNQEEGRTYLIRKHVVDRHIRDSDFLSNTRAAERLRVTKRSHNKYND
jgi:hypothetical protein